MRNGRSPVLWLIGILCPLVSVLFSCEEGFVDINLHSDVVCGLTWHRSKGVMCEIWRRTCEIPISVDIISFRGDKLWQIVRWNLYLSRNLFGNLLRHESKTFPLNLIYIYIYIYIYLFKVYLLLFIDEPKLRFTSKSFLFICISLMSYCKMSCINAFFRLRTLHKLCVL